MNISIQSKGGTPIYEQIVTQIKEAILAGKLNNCLLYTSDAADE